MIKFCFLFVFAFTILELSNAKLDNCPAERRKGQFINLVLDQFLIKSFYKKLFFLFMSTGADRCARDVFFLMDPNYKPSTAETLPDYCK